ncbi:MAG: IS630 family transposase [Nostoc sp. S4]|nr:IS630 family transposase [Nostoc sp. S4]
MAKPYSYDLRQKVINAIVLDGMKKTEAAQIFQISRNTINLWLQRHAQTGDYHPKSNRPNRTNAKITDWEKFSQFAQIHGDKTQAQMAQLWSLNISKRTISRGLKKIGVSKKKTYGYRERDDSKRAIFIQQLEKIPDSLRVYVDESGMDARDDYGYGWCKRGQRFEALKSGRRTGRVNMIAAYCQQQLMAPFTVEGACNRVVFETWVTTSLIPVLQPGQVIILDNATFHHGGRIAQLIEQVGCHLLYLPPYSPDLNRIEKCWAWLKSRIRQILSDEYDLRQVMESVLKSSVS